MSGWIYIFVNEAVPNHVKVGYTERDPEIRAKELASTGLPGIYSVSFAIEVDDPKSVERSAHKLLSEFHYHNEWFKCTLDVARRAIQESAKEDQINMIWSQSESRDCNTPLVPGHALEPYFTFTCNSDKSEKENPNQPIFTVAQDSSSQTYPQSDRPLFGDMNFQCRHCSNLSTIPTTRFPKCQYCGRTEVLN